VSAADGQATVSVDDKPLASLPAAVAGGIGLGVWRENEASPTPVFSGLAINGAGEARAAAPEGTHESLRGPRKR
jgi:hypothetical protein